MKSRSLLHISAFTLIELLIVVAIIGILAAIAVPNFLNAQSRAKLANVYGSMKTIQTAIAAYQVDYNSAPIDYGNDALTGQTYVVLTTPTAYLSSIDVFRDIYHTAAEEDTGFYFAYGAPWHIGKFTDPEQIGRYKRANISYFFFSWGPDRKANWPWAAPETGLYMFNTPHLAGPNQDGGIFYSPSNGLTSLGDIVTTDSKIFQ